MNKFEAMREQIKQGVQAISSPDLYCTPQAIVARMITEADIQPHHLVLEPSAGTGAIMRELLPLCLRVEGIELNFNMAHALIERGFEVKCKDFLEYNGGDWYDRILMNPPFERLQDTEHVMWAFESYLKPSGRLVSIMSPAGFFHRSKKAESFMDWFDLHGGTVEVLPKNSFKESGTGVNTVIVVIDK